MDIEYTNDELNILKNYKDKDYESVNQLLVSNCDLDLLMLGENGDKDIDDIVYDRKNIIKNLDIIKSIYRLCLKYFYNTKHKQEVFYRGTNIAEIDRLKQEPFIDRMWSASKMIENAESFYAQKWEKPVLIELTVDEEVPFIDIDKILKNDEKTNEILLPPFTKIKSIEEDTDINLEEKKLYKAYKITIEKQTLDELSEKEREGLYGYILENSYSIKRKLEECINLENTNTTNYENVRKLEEVYAQYLADQEEKEMSGNYPDIEREEDYKDISRIERELNKLKEITNNIFEVRKENINFINMWKRNIAVYMIAECKAIEDEFKDMTAEYYTEEEIEAIKEGELNIDPIDENVEAVSLEDADPDVNLNVESSVEPAEVEETEEDASESEVPNEENEEEPKQEEKVETEETEEFVDDNPMHQRVIGECKENIASVKKLMHNIENLIFKQQNFARIAGNMDSQYSALNNAFDMRKVAETLLLQVKAIYEEVKNLCQKGDNDKINLKLELISSTNIEIGTLLNYLNNPRILNQSSNATRFDELAIIEENYLKRGIAEKIKSIRSEAELKKLQDDLEIIEDRGNFSRFIGIFTGKNKLDEVMIDQIAIRKDAIRKNLKVKMKLTSNYSIHELMAEITMFVNENEDDELVQNEVTELKSIAAELRKNYVIVEPKIEAIIQKREGRNLPMDKKMKKVDIIEAETFKFLRKYNYDIADSGEAEPDYQDTVANEIARIVDYINTSKVI